MGEVDWGKAMGTFVRHGAEFERDALLHRKPVESVTDQLGDTGPRRKPQNKTGSRAHHRLKGAEQTERSVGQDTIAVVQSTEDHRTDECVCCIERQRAAKKS